MGDRMKRIEPFWKGLSRQERVEVMTMSVAEVKAQARLVAKRDAQAADGMVLQQLAHCLTADVLSFLSPAHTRNPMQHS